MPFCSCQTIRSLYYEVYGNGPPLILISGLSGGTWSWVGQIPFFERFYRTIVFDNRGAGRSEIPPGPYSIGSFAEDTLCLLDHLEVEKALVLGISMGGMIAQELALLAPGRIQALVLGCTHCGGSSRIPPTPDVLAKLINNDGLTPEQIADKNLPLFLSEATLRGAPDVVAAYRTLQIEGMVQPEEAFRAQLQAIGAFDCCDRLSHIRIPTLIIAGTEDVLVPVGNARILADRIHLAQLMEIPNAGHALHVECKDLLNKSAHELFRRYAF